MKTGIEKAKNVFLQDLNHEQNFVKEEEAIIEFSKSITEKDWIKSILQP